MASYPASPKRRAVPTSRMKILQMVKLFLSKKLPDVTEAELNSFLSTLGGPKNFTNKDIARIVQDNIAIWLLNHILAQLKKTLAQQAKKKPQKDDPENEDSNENEKKDATFDIPLPSTLRTAEIRVVAFILAHLPHINTLFIHSHVLMKMATIRTTWAHVTHDMLSKEEFSNPCLKGIDNKDVEMPHNQYRDMIVAMSDHLTSLYYKLPHESAIPRACNRVCMGMDANEISAQIAELVRLFAIWNHGIQRVVPSQKTRKVAVLIVSILSALAKMLAIWMRIFRDVLQSSTNVKNAYNTLMGIMERLMFLKAEVDDFRTYARYLASKNSAIAKEVCVNTINGVADAVAESITHSLSFAFTRKVISGLRDTLTSKDYSEYMEVDQLGNMDLENSSVVYNRKFFIKIITILHRAETEAMLFKHARGLSTMLPAIFDNALEALGEMTDDKHQLSYYGVMMLVVIIRLLMKLTKGTKLALETQQNSYNHCSGLLTSIEAIHHILHFANKRQLLVYSGEGTTLLTKLMEDVVEFLICSLEEAYQRANKTVKRRLLKEQVDGDNVDVKWVLRNIYHSSQTTIFLSSVMLTIPMLWDSLMLLVSIDLEHADKNMQRILQLSNQDHSLEDTEKYEIEAYNMLIMPKVCPTELRSSKRSHTFLGNLISMYSHANDMSSLVNHIGRCFTETRKPKQRCAFLTHPSGIMALHRSSKESNVSQIPVVIKSFTEWVKNKKANKFIMYPFICYLSGIEISSTVVTKVAVVLEELLSTIQCDHTPEGLLMVIYALITVRKVCAWDGIKQDHSKWATYIKGLYNYACQISDMVGSGCSIEVWKGLFWLAYHLTLIRSEHPTVYEDMNTGIEKMLRRLKSCIDRDHSNRDFIEEATTLVVTNSTVFRNMKESKELVKHALGVLMSKEIDEGLLQRIVHMIDILEYVEGGIYDFVDIGMLNRILGSMMKEGATISLKKLAIHVVNMSLQYCSNLFMQPGIVEAFHQLVQVMRLPVTENCFNEPGAMDLINSCMKNLLLILHREKSLGYHLCMESTMAGYDKLLSTDKRENEREHIKNADCPLLASLNALREQIKVAPGLQMQRSIETLKTMAAVYATIVKGLMSHTFLKGDVKKRRVEIGQKTLNAFMHGLFPTVLDDDNNVDMHEIEMNEVNESVSIERRLLEAILLSYTLKLTRGHTAGSEVSLSDALKMKGSVIEVLSILTEALCEYNPAKVGYLLYCTHMLQMISTDNIEEQHIEKVYDHISKLQSKVSILPQFQPCLLESLKEALIVTLLKAVEKSSETQIHSRIVESLFVVSCIQQVLYMKRSKALDNKGTQLEVFKALCGNQDSDVSAITQIVFDKLKAVKFWNMFVTDVERLYNQAGCDEAPYNWIMRAAAFEVLMLPMENKYLKSLSNIKGSRKRLILNDIEIFLNLYSNHISQGFNQKEEEGREYISWVLMNYIMNTTVSIKMFSLTKFIVNKQLERFHYAFSEQLLDLARIGIEFLKGKPSDGVIYHRVATNVYICLYTCIRTVEGMTNTQAAKLARPWMKRVQVAVYIVTQFVELIANNDAELFACVARWIAIISGEQLRDATRWYLPHMLSAIIKRWHDVTKDIANYKDKDTEILRSNRILKNCILDSTGVLDDMALQAMFLLLTPQLRLFMKENTNLFDGK